MPADWCAPICANLGNEVGSLAICIDNMCRHHPFTQFAEKSAQSAILATGDHRPSLTLPGWGGGHRLPVSRQPTCAMHCDAPKPTRAMHCDDPPTHTHPPPCTVMNPHPAGGVPNLLRCIKKEMPSRGGLISRVPHAARALAHLCKEFQPAGEALGNEPGGAQTVATAVCGILRAHCRLVSCVRCIGELCVLQIAEPPPWNTVERPKFAAAIVE